MATKAQVNNFIDKLSTLARVEYQKRKNARQKWVLPSVCIAQSALETGWGTSALMVKANAFFGIKTGTGWSGKVYSTKTQECYNDKDYTTITDLFRAYDSLEESVTDYYDLITGLPRYARACNQSDAQTCIQAIKDGGYATSPTYVDNVMSIINQYSLTRYDKEETNMNQPKLIMDKAASYIGTEENPPGSNNVIFNTDYYGGPVNGSWYPWCCAFVWDVFRMCGLSSLFYDGQKTAYCPTVYNWAKQKGLIVPKTEAKYGDIVLFDWDGDGVADHIGFVETYNTGGYLTIEGNTSSGNDSNGGKVMRRTRYTSQIQAIIRPKYTESAPEIVPETWKATGTATSTVNNLYVRAEPNGVVLGELMKGNRFEVDGKTSGNWTHVKVANIGIGYVYTAYISHDSASAAGNSVTAISGKQDKTRRLFVGEVTADVLNVRTWAGTGNPCIRSYPQLKRGNLVDVMDFTQKDENGDSWYYVKIAGKYYGFVHSQYIKKK